jgi:hypothetical protein
VEGQGQFEAGNGLRRAGLALLVLIVVGTALLGLWSRAFARRGLEQPIAFSHELHAGEKKIPCQYCHAYARRSTVAGVPSVQTCMGCHQLIAVRKPEVRKLAAYWEQKAPIPWVKIHNLPDFVYFSHKRHVEAGVACQRCHGPVETMKEVHQVESLEMGWCLGCHMEVARTHEFGPAIEPSVDCATCHK